MSNWIDSEVLAGHFAAFIVALAAFFAIGALLFHRRRMRTRELARKLHP